MNKPTPEQVKAMRAWAHTPEVSSAIREGVQAMKEGKVMPANTFFDWMRAKYVRDIWEARLAEDRAKLEAATKRGKEAWKQYDRLVVAHHSLQERARKVRTELVNLVQTGELKDEAFRWAQQRAIEAEAQVGRLIKDKERLEETIRIGEEDFSPEIWEQVLQERDEYRHWLGKAWKKLDFLEKLYLEVGRERDEANRQLAAVREKLAQKIDSLGAVVFVEDNKEREMLAKCVVLTVIRQAPLDLPAAGDRVEKLAEAWRNVLSGKAHTDWNDVGELYRYIQDYADAALREMEGK